MSNLRWHSTRLTKEGVDYIIQHSGAKLILVDHEFVHLVEGTSLPVIISQDSGKDDDPYEQFLGALTFTFVTCLIWDEMLGTSSKWPKIQPRARLAGSGNGTR